MEPVVAQPRPSTMRVDDHVQPGVRSTGGRLRFSICTSGFLGRLRLMVLDDSGAVRHRMAVHSDGTRIPMCLTGFARGRIFLVCAFADDELIWSGPVLAG